MQEDLDKSEPWLCSAPSARGRRVDLRLACRQAARFRRAGEAIDRRLRGRRDSTGRRSPRSSITWSPRIGSWFGKTTASATTATSIIRNTSRPTSTTTTPTTPRAHPARISNAVAQQRREVGGGRSGRQPRRTGMTPFPDAESNIWFAANRTPLVEGYVSESMDGRQVAPLMGDYPDADVGTLRIRTLPNFWNHSSCDHAVSTRLLPAGLQRTAIRVSWLVDQDAVEGRDYRLEKLMPFWQLTSEQDWVMCEQAQKGISRLGTCRDRFPRQRHVQSTGTARGPPPPASDGGAGVSSRAWRPPRRCRGRRPGVLGLDMSRSVQVALDETFTAAEGRELPRASRTRRVLRSRSSHVRPSAHGRRRRRRP